MITTRKTTSKATPIVKQFSYKNFAGDGPPFPAGDGYIPSGLDYMNASGKGNSTSFDINYRNKPAASANSFRDIDWNLKSSSPKSTKAFGYANGGAVFSNANGGAMFSNAAGVQYTAKDIPTLTSQKQEYQNQIAKYAKEVVDAQASFDAAVASAKSFYDWRNQLLSGKKTRSYDSMYAEANAGINLWEGIKNTRLAELNLAKSKLDVSKRALIDVSDILNKINISGSAQPSSNPAVPAAGSTSIITAGASTTTKLLVGAGVLIVAVIGVWAIKKALTKN